VQTVRLPANAGLTSELTDNCKLNCHTKSMLHPSLMNTCLLVYHPKDIWKPLLMSSEFGYFILHIKLWLNVWILEYSQPWNKRRAKTFAWWLHLSRQRRSLANI
jgi:hypothetical protein